MWRHLACAFVVTVIAALPAVAADAKAVDGVVVSYEKNKLTVTLKDGDKTFDLPDRVHVHDADGKEIKAADRAGKLKKGVKVELELKDGKIEEVNIKK